MLKNCGFKHVIFIGLLLLLSTSLWLIYSSHFILKQKKSDHADTFMVNMQALKLDQFGNPHYQFESPLVNHYPENDLTQSEKPFLIVYKPNQPPWHIHADHGTSFNGDEKIILKDHVKINQLPGENSHNATMTTTELTVFPNRSFAQTDQPVTIVQPGINITGIGMEADFNKNWMKLLSKARGFYDKEIAGE